MDLCVFALPSLLKINILSYFSITNDFTLGVNN